MSCTENIELKAFDESFKLKSFETKKLPYPKFGILENPFGADFNAPSGFKVLDDNPNNTQNDDEPSGCFVGVDNYDAAKMQLTSAYYDYNMHAPFVNRGYSTSNWNGLPKQFAIPPQLILWPKNRCVHGGNMDTKEKEGKGGDGINKDHTGRRYHLQARQSAVEASRNFMLEFLRLSGAATQERKIEACKLIFDCVDSIKPTISNIKLSAITSNAEEKRNIWSFTASNNLNASMLAASFNGAECEVFEYEPFEGFEKQPALMCPSTYKGKGTLKIYQKANPTFVLHQVDNFSVNPEVTIDHYPLSGLTGVIGICTFCDSLVSHGVVASYDINWGDGNVESFTMGNQHSINMFMHQRVKN